MNFKLCFFNCLNLLVRNEKLIANCPIEVFFFPFLLMKDILMISNFAFPFSLSFFHSMTFTHIYSHTRNIKLINDGFIGQFGMTREKNALTPRCFPHGSKRDSKKKKWLIKFYYSALVRRAFNSPTFHVFIRPSANNALG